jgi:23S rRNA (cytidine1920-2'-O)/16S rRNA (cytidine1409-2'-O)-methyltransferase
MVQIKIMRLDQYIAEKYSFTRNKAQQLIKSALISVNGKNILKVSFEIWDEDIISIKEDKSIAWVSRSAGKLDSFLNDVWMTNPDLRFTNTHCLDIGSSTGGFSQILLERGASHIDAVDVGSDQFHAKLRDNDKISLYEKTDIRDFRTHGTHLEWWFTNDNLRMIIYDIITCDVSFISLRQIIPEILRFSDSHTHIFLLFKPQFEVGRVHLRKTWVPKNEKIILKSFADFRIFLEKNNFQIFHESKASVIGEAGNQEYMLYVKKI